MDATAVLQKVKDAAARAETVEESAIEAMTGLGQANKDLAQAAKDASARGDKAEATLKTLIDGVDSVGDKVIADAGSLADAITSGTPAEVLVAMPSGTPASSKIGDTVQLAVAPAIGHVTGYASSDEAVATVDAKGLVTAVAAGTAKITASTSLGHQGSIDFVVAAADAGGGTGGTTDTSVLAFRKDPFDDPIKFKVHEDGTPYTLAQNALADVNLHANSSNEEIPSDSIDLATLIESRQGPEGESPDAVIPDEVAGPYTYEITKGGAVALSGSVATVRRDNPTTGTGGDSGADRDADHPAGQPTVVKVTNALGHTLEIRIWVGVM